MMGGRIRLGLLGAGRWGRNYIRTIATLPDVTLAAVASSNPETRSLVPDGCRVLASWSDLVALEDIDGVVIATPPHLHATMLLAAAAAGKAVLVEKPLVLTLEDLARVTRAAEAANRPIMVENTHLFHPAFRALVTEAHGRGQIRGIRASAGAHGPYRVDVPVLWDWGSHDIAMCLALDAGPWTAVGAQRAEARVVDGFPAERLHLQMRSDSGIAAQLTLSTLDDKHRWFAVDLDGETLIYSDQGPSKLQSLAHAGARHDEQGTAIPVRDEPPLTRALVEFAAAIRNDDRSDDSLRIGIETVRLLSSFDTLMRDAPSD